MSTRAWYYDFKINNHLFYSFSILGEEISHLTYECFAFGMLVFHLKDISISLIVLAEHSKAIVPTFETLHQRNDNFNPFISKVKRDIQQAFIA